MSPHHSERNASMERLVRGSSTPLSLDECSAHNGHQKYPYDGESTDWKKCHNGAEDFWRSQKLDMPRLIPVYARGSSLAPESMEDVNRYPPRFKSEAIEQELPSAVGRGSMRQQHGNVQPLLEDLPYIPYETKRQLGGTSSPEHIYFRVGGGHGYGALPLSKALQEDLESLLDGHMAAPLVDASTKLSIRLQFDGCVHYTRQIMARRSTPQSEPISMKVLAHKIANEMDQCLIKTRKAGKPLMHKGQVVWLEDLYLWRLVRVSPGSWVPEFKVKPWNPA